MFDQSFEEQLPLIFEQAKIRYKELTGHTIESIEEIPSDIDGLMGNLKDRSKDFDAFRKKWDSIRKVLKPFAELVNGLAEVLGEGIPLIPVPVILS